MSYTQDVHIAVGQQQKARIQDLLAKMFRAVSPRDHDNDCPVYAWFPSPSDTGEMEPVDTPMSYELQDEDVLASCAETVSLDAVGVDTVVDAPIIVSETSFVVPMCEQPQPIVLPEPGPLFHYLNGSFQTPIATIGVERIAVRRATTGDIIAIRDEKSEKPLTGLVMRDVDGVLFVHCRKNWGWQKKSLTELVDNKLVLAAYRIDEKAAV